MNREEGDKKPTVYTPGGLFKPTGLFFEQIEGNTYVMWDADCKQLIEQDYVNYGKVYQPLQKLLWFPPDKPLEYDDAELWNEIRQFIYDHLFLPDNDLYDVLTAWVKATWTPELWPVVPYVFFYGPVASGKTRGLEVLHRLAYRGMLAVNASAAAIAYAIDNWKATIILDETEIYNRSEKVDIIGMLNSGYKVGQNYMRIKYVDGQKQPDYAETFGFKALAGTHSLAKTLESRSIIIRMIKNRRKVRLFIDEKKARELRSKLLSYRMKTLIPAVKTKTKDDLNKSVKDELSEVFLERVPPLELSNARNNELFQCLLAVSNHGQKYIVKYAEKMDKISRNEEMASEEAELVELLCNMGLTGKSKVVLTSVIKDKWNATRSDKEKWNAKALGWLIRRLGFTKKHTGQGNGWIISPERLEFWRQNYFGDSTHSGKSSETSKSSLTSFESVSIEDLVSVHWVDEPLAEHECGVCGYVRETVHKAITNKNAEIWICEPCFQDFEAKRKVI